MRNLSKGKVRYPGAVLRDDMALNQLTADYKYSVIEEATGKVRIFAVRCTELPEWVRDTVKGWTVDSENRRVIYKV